MFATSLKRLGKACILASSTKNLSSSARPFNVLGIQQIAVGAASKSDLNSFWVDKLGITKVGEYRSEKENVDEDILTLGSGATVVEIDLMEPINPDKAPRVNVPALNHVGLWVDDIHAAVATLSSQGVVFTPGGVRKGASGFDVTFIHPKSACGVLVELVQAPKHVQDFHNENKKK